MKDFERLAVSTISQAEAIRCPFSDFVEGLELLLERIQERLTLAKQEMKDMDWEPGDA